MLGEAKAVCSSVAETTMHPASSKIKARVPPVPTSIPRTYLRIISLVLFPRVAIERLWSSSNTSCRRKGVRPQRVSGLSDDSNRHLRELRSNWQGNFEMPTQIEAVSLVTWILHPVWQFTLTGADQGASGGILCGS